MTQNKLIGSLITGFIVIIMLVSLNPIVIVGAGERGVVFNKATGVEDQIMGEGLHFRMPFVQSVKEVDVRVQTAQAIASAGTSDLQTVQITTVVNWRMNPDRVNTIYQEIGNEEQVVVSIITPRVEEIVKSTSAQFTAEELLTKRGQLKTDIATKLREELSKYNIILSDVSLANISYSQSFDAAIERKVTAEQDAQAAKNKLAQVEFEAEQRVTQAKAEAEAIKINAESLLTNGGQQYVNMKAVEKWDGKLPQQFVPGSAVPFLNLK